MPIPCDIIAITRPAGGKPRHGLLKPPGCHPDRSERRAGFHSMICSPATKKPVMLNFIFTSCTAICPVMTGTFQQVQHHLGTDSAKRAHESRSPSTRNTDSTSRTGALCQALPCGVREWALVSPVGPKMSSASSVPSITTGATRSGPPLPVTLLHASPQSQWVRYDGFASATDLAKRSTADDDQDPDGDNHDRQS